MDAKTMRNVKEVNKGDVIAFKANDQRYKALLCTSTFKERSPHYFTFAALSTNQEELPNLEEIQESCFYGIGNRKDSTFGYSENELVIMWSVHPEIKPYFLGSYGLTIWRKDFIKFRENLVFVGQLNIIENLDMNGNGSINASDWDFLKDFFDEKYTSNLAEKGQKLFKIKAIIT
ncbi:hypothetical protein [Flagellimonas meishanensis]|uniref:hypothetical protein n=1 Tax=Flagellimonas meishanensis TaxID=2873264 RepID=UPI001CA660C7|nr:hypothetical protein [[Muricauda] meishanensis]